MSYDIKRAKRVLLFTGWPEALEKPVPMTLYEMSAEELESAEQAKKADQLFRVEHFTDKVTFERLFHDQAQRCLGCQRLLAESRVQHFLRYDWGPGIYCDVCSPLARV